jgi:hypothetical protein
MLNLVQTLINLNISGQERVAALDPPVQLLLSELNPRLTRV